jgi:hypothetical protein
VEKLSSPSLRGFLLGLAAATAFAAAGCNANGCYPVRGTVFLDGQPATELAGGTVTFDSAELHRSASGSIREDGSYRLSSFGKDDGAAPGTYQVTVSPPETPPAGERGKHAGAKSAAFAEPKELQVTVEAKGNDIPIELHRRATGTH